MKAITRKQAQKIGERSGYPITENDGRTFYATDEKESEVWEYDSKKERDEAVERNKDF